jgi:hypothetical protein
MIAGHDIYTIKTPLKMKNSVEYRKLLTAKQEELRKIATENEGKPETDEIRSEMDRLLSEIDQLDADIQRAEKVEAVEKRAAEAAARQRNPRGPEPGKPDERELDNIAKNLSLVDGVRAAYGIDKLEGRLLEMHQEGENELRMLGIPASKDAVIIPGSMLSRTYTDTLEKRANIVEGNSTGIQQMDFVHSVYAKTCLETLGATFIPALQDARVPVIGQVGVEFEGETDANTDGGAATVTKTLTPKRISAYANISKQAIIQDNKGLVNAVQNAFVKAVKSHVELACFTDKSSDGAWNYLGNGKTAVENASTTDLVLALVAEVLGNDEMDGNLGFAISSALYDEIYTAVQATGVSALVEDGMINGMPFAFSTQIANPTSGDPGIYFGAWDMVYLAQFGGLEITLDNLTQARSGMDALTVNTFWDMKLIRDNAISVGSKQ